MQDQIDSSKEKIEELPEFIFKKIMFPGMVVLNSIRDGEYFGEVAMI